MMLCDLPSELLFMIGENLHHFSNLNALVRTDRYLYQLFNPLLYCNALKNVPNGALEWVARKGRKKSVRQFLRAGLQIGLECEETWHPVFIATENGHLGVVKMMLKSGIIVDQLTEPRHDQNYELLLGELLTVAAKYGRKSIVSWLIKYGANLDPSARFIGDAIYQACHGRHVAIMKLLFSTSCGKRFVRHDGITKIVRYAAAQELSLLLILIHAGVRISSSLSLTYLGRVAFTSAQWSGNLRVVKFFLDNEYIPRSYLLNTFNAPALRHPPLASLCFEYLNTKKLVSYGDDVDNHNLLMGALLVGNKCLSEKLFSVLYPLKDLQISPTSAKSLMKAAVYSHDVQMVELVLRGRAWTKVGTSTFPDLHYAIGQHRNDIARLLLDVIGHPLFELGRLIQTALSCGNVDIAQLLHDRYLISHQNLTANASSMIKAAVLGGEASFNTILRWGVNLQYQDPVHKRALEIAVSRARIPVIRAFMEAGFDPNLCSPKSERSLLSIAATSDEPCSTEAVDILLESGASVDLAFSHVASAKLSISDFDNCATESFSTLPRGITKVFEERRLRGAELLLEKGADPFALDSNGESLFVLAAYEGFLPMIKLFLCFLDKDEDPLRFHQIKHFIWQAAFTGHRDTAQCLSNYYWRHI